MDEVQEEFEVWLKSGGNLTMKEDNGEYSFQHTRFAFEAWKASRKTVIVKLPHESAIWWFDEVCDALDDVGVKYE